jgi:hypothetical protein
MDESAVGGIVCIHEISVERGGFFVRPNALFTGPALRYAERPTRRTRRAALGPSGTER